MNKKEIRNLYKSKRLVLSADDLEMRSERICENVLANFQLEGKVCSLFLPIKRQKEINTYLLLDKGISIGAHMILPKCEENHTLKHFLFEHHNQLQTNSLGIPEPQSGKLVSSKNIDIVFVPLLALDRNGNRVGYGKGYYDRFLKRCKPSCTFIGLHLFEDFEDIQDIELTDVPLHYCVTPEKIHHFVKE